MASLTYYKRATEELLEASKKEGEKYYGDAREHYEKSIEYFIGALQSKAGKCFCIISSLI